MSARHVIADALSARQEELTGEASPIDYDGARLVLRCLEAAGFTITKTDDGAADAVQSMGGSLPPAASSSPTGPGPAVIGGQPGPVRQPRIFELYRHRDVTGKSGVGTVAWGAQWPDGTVALRWVTAHPSSVHWDSVEAVLAVHGHGGATEIRWLSDVPIDLWPAEGGDRG